MFGSGVSTGPVNICVEQVSKQTRASFGMDQSIRSSVSNEAC